jgi:hypothetical protein
MYLKKINPKSTKMFLVVFGETYIDDLQTRSAYATIDIAISNLLKSEIC